MTPAPTPQELASGRLQRLDPELEELLESIEEEAPKSLDPFVHIAGAAILEVAKRKRAALHAAYRPLEDDPNE